jgi:Ni/Co efflux regulator RcnB
MGYANAFQAEITMTRLLISAAFAGLVAFGGSAWAQDDHRDRGGRNQQPAAQPAPAPQQGGGPANTPHGPSSGGFMNFGAARGAAPSAQGGPGPSNAQRGPAPNERALNNNDRGGDNNNMRGPNNDRRDRGNNNNMRGPDNNGRGQAFGNDRRGERRDFSSFHRNFNAPRRFRVGSYQRPSGWYAHRWSYGEILPSIFWGQNYWLTDYYDYGLEPPPPGTVWVRDGEDALLIDRFSGEIIQVAYSVFY